MDANNRLKSLGITITILSLRISTLLTKLFIVFFIARNMDVSSVGQYGLIAGLIVTVPVFLGFGIINEIARDAVTDSILEMTKKIAGYTTFILVIYIISFFFILPLIFDSHLRDTFISVFFLVIFAHFNENIFLLLISLKKSVWANFIYFVRGSLWGITFSLSVTLKWVSPNIETLLLIWILNEIIAFLLFILLTYKWPWSFERSILDSVKTNCIAAKRNIWLFSDTSCSAAAMYLDRYIVGIVLGLEAVGVYTIFWSISHAIRNLVRNGVILNYRTKMISVLSKSKNVFHTILRKSILESLLLLSLLIFPVIIFHNELIDILGNEKLERDSVVLIILLFSTFPRVIFDVYESALHAQFKDRLNFSTNLLLLSTSAISVTLGASLYDLLGASICLLASYTLATLARIKFHNRAF